MVEGQPQGTIDGEKMVVRAQIHTLSGFSAHCGQTDLLNWLAPVAPSKPDVVLAGEVRKRFGLRTAMPRMGKVLEF